MHTYRILDDDGGTYIKKDGTERQRTSLVLIGDSYCTWHEKGVKPPPVKRSQTTSRADGS